MLAYIAMTHKQKRLPRLNSRQGYENDNVAIQGDIQSIHDSQHDEGVSEEGFHLFLELPVELRVEIYRLAVLNVTKAIHMLGIYYGRGQRGPLVVLTKQARFVPVVYDKFV